MGKTVDVLWTGGWDSTFRVLFASFVEKKEVRPHYIIDLGRKSSLREIKAISEVRKELEKIDRAAAMRVKELAITPVTEIMPLEEVAQAYQRLKSEAYLGNQYDWLSRYARQKNIDDLELSVHVDDKAYYFLEGKVEKRGEGGWRLSGSAEGDIKIFSCFSFPILEISKTEMRAKAEEFGFIEALEKSWFCFNPINDKPCGNCKPCTYAIEEGMGYRLPTTAIFRYKTRSIRKTAKSIRKAMKLPLLASRRVYGMLRG